MRHLVESAHFSTDTNLPFEVLSYLMAENSWCQKEESCPGRLCSRHFEPQVSPCPRMWGHQWRRATCLLRRLWSQGGENVLLPSQCHLMAATAVTLSTEMDWLWPFRLTGGGYKPTRFLRLFYMCFQAYTTILSALWVRLKGSRNLIIELIILAFYDGERWVQLGASCPDSCRCCLISVTARGAAHFAGLGRCTLRDRKLEGAERKTIIKCHLSVFFFETVNYI